MKILWVLPLFALSIWAAAKESSEKEYLSFVFVGRTHHLIIKTGHGQNHIKCYVINLTDDEIKNAHTDAGMSTIELKYIRMIVVAKPVTPDQLADYDRLQCIGRSVSQNTTVEWFTL